MKTKEWRLHEGAKHAAQMWLPFDEPNWPPTCPWCKLQLEKLYGGMCLGCSGCWTVFSTIPTPSMKPPYRVYTNGDVFDPK